MHSVYLVACVGKKRESAMAAKDLYCSAWFLKAKRFVELRGGPWFILSAKHGLVHSGEVISPYDSTLNEMSVSERRAWADLVLGQLLPLVRKGSQVIFLAGNHYREHLIPALEVEGVEVSIPMRGLGIGKQLSWFNANS